MRPGPEGLCRWGCPMSAVMVALTAPGPGLSVTSACRDRAFRVVVDRVERMLTPGAAVPGRRWSDGSTGERPQAQPLVRVDDHLRPLRPLGKTQTQPTAAMDDSAGMTSIQRRRVPLRRYRGRRASRSRCRLRRAARRRAPLGRRRPRRRAAPSGWWRSPPGEAARAECAAGAAPVTSHENVSG